MNNLIKGVRILSDQPELSEPYFNFDIYAKSLFGIITSEWTDTPLVIGIYGDWGSGKTSLMRTIDKKIESDNSIKTIWFNAWKYDNEESIRRVLLMRILQELIVDLKKKDIQNNDNSKDSLFVKMLTDLQDSLYHDVYREEPGAIKFNLDKIVKTIVRLGFSEVPLLRKFVDVEGKSILNEFFEAFQREKRIVSVNKVQFIEHFHKTFEDTIRRYEKKRIVVFIDDLDRCNPDKLIEVLESIKLFLDVEGCIFILGIDRRVASSVMSHKYDYITEEGVEIISGENYLEKIIQLSFQLPPITDEDMRKFIENLSIPQFYKDKNNLNMLVKGVENNPRKIKHLINIIELQRNLVDSIPDIQIEYFIEKTDEQIEPLIKLWNLIFNEYPEFRKAVLKDNWRLLNIQEYLEEFSGKQPGTLPIRFDDLGPFLDNNKLLEQIQEVQQEIKEKPTIEDIKTVIHKKTFEVLMMEWAIISNYYPEFCKAVLKENWKLLDIHEYIKFIDSQEKTENLPEKFSELTEFLGNGGLLKLIREAQNGIDILELNDIKRVIHLSHFTNKKETYETNIGREGVIDKINKNESLKGLDLRGADLKRIELIKQDLSYSDLTGAELNNSNLEQSSLHNAILTNASLENATLENVDLSHSNLTGTNLTRVKLIQCDLHDAIMNKSIFFHATLKNMDLIELDFTGADLTYVNLIHINLKRTIIKDVGLTGAYLSNVDASNLDFSGVDLSNAKLSHVIFDNADLDKAKLQNVRLLNVRLWYTKLNGVHLEHSIIKYSDFYRADLTSAHLTDAILSNSGFRSAIMVNTNMVRVKLQNCDFGNANLKETEFKDVDIDDSTIDKLKNSKWNAAKWDKPYPFNKLQEIETQRNVST